MMPLAESVTVSMRAPAREVWALVSDVTRIGEFSPETLAGRWIGGATGPAVGAKFQGHVKRNGRGPMYWTSCRVVECEPERVFAFVVEAPGTSGVNTWRYALRANEAATEVTESFALSDSLIIRAYWTLFGARRTKTNVRGMRQTLERIRAVVEAI
ncbi:MAG TPA: SRPBCC family protein [Sporichthyaceae bacterium]|jgi:hypothetical protein